MKGSVPDWKRVNDPRYFHHLFPAPNEKNYVCQDDNLTELLWENGQVVLHNQMPCSSPATIAELKQTRRTEYVPRCRGSHGSLMNLIDEAESWYLNPFGKSTENEFQEFFFGMQSPDSIVNDKQIEGQLCLNFSSAKETNTCTTQSSNHPNDSMILPPQSTGIRNFGGTASGADTMLTMGDSPSMLTIESETCGSNENQVLGKKTQHQEPTNKDVMEKSLQESEAPFEQLSSSSGDSGSSFRVEEQQVMMNHGNKRKERDEKESEHYNGEQLSPKANKHGQKTPPLRRSRAAEIHNLSERRRRDRINEKMKALQDLIPNCNKPDKASMLDEAIEYLKSLQLQVQIMWMGGGMASTMFPGFQQHLPRMVTLMDHSPLPQIPNPFHLPGATLYNQFIPPMFTPTRPPVCPSPELTPLNLINKIPNVQLPAPLSHYFSFPGMQMAPQVMGMNAFGAKVMQHKQSAAAVVSNHLPPLRTSSDKIDGG